MKKMKNWANLLGMGILCLGIGCAPRPAISTVETDTGTATTTTELPEAARVGTSAAYDAYVGQYEMQESQIGKVTISVENGRLQAQAGTMPRTELMPTTTTDQFTIPNTDVQVTFTRQGQDAVTGMQVRYEGQTFTGRKVQ